MKITIVKHSPHKSITHYESDMNEINAKVYNTLTKYGIEEEKAIDCASWCELACDGESYNEDDFDVYVEAEED